MKEERVILVDTHDNQIGTMSKMEAHEQLIHSCDHENKD